MSLTQQARAAVPRRQWNDYVEAHPEGWFLHTSAWLDYALAYTPGAIDRSTAILHGTRLVGLIPGVVSAGGAPVYGGQAHPAALVDVDAGIDCKVGGHRDLVVAYRPGIQPIDDPLPGFACHEEATYVIDLWEPEATRWRAIRKSYRQLIRTAEQAWDISVMSQTAADTYIAIAKGIHTACAGRQTRPDATWECQGDWLRAGYGVMALAVAKTDGMAVGFAYALRMKGWAYYFSGASTVRNVQHALQWRLMQALATDGVTQYYEIGHDAEAGADAKTQAIAFFKRGFGGARLPVITVRAA